MKKFKILAGTLVLAAAFLFGGCYTQLSTKPFANQEYSYTPNRDSQNDGYNDEYYTDSTYSNDSGYYNDEEYEDYDGEYYQDGAVNNYYIGAPFYRRYFSHYYPTISVGVYYGSYFYDPFWYDPFYYDPWAWCGTCYPSYYSPFAYYYPRNYGYGYYDYWYGSSTSYKYRNERRSDNMTSLRNTDGLRGGLGSRDSRGALTTLSRERAVTDTKDFSKRSTREAEALKAAKRTDNREIIRGNDKTRNITPNERTKIIPEKGNRNTEIQRVDPRKDQNRNKRNESYYRYKNKENNGRETRVQREYKPKPNNNGNDSRVRKNDGRERKYVPKYTPPKKKEGTRNKTYNPPKRTYSPPRSAPPQRTYSPPRSAPPQRSSPPSRGSSSSNDSGRRR